MPVMTNIRELDVTHGRHYRRTSDLFLLMIPFQLWKLFFTYSWVSTHCACQAAINHLLHLPICISHSCLRERFRLRQPWTSRFQNVLDEFCPVRSIASGNAYSQKHCYKGNQFRNATGIRQRSSEGAGRGSPTGWEMLTHAENIADFPVTAHPLQTMKISHLSQIISVAYYKAVMTKLANP